MLLGGIEAGGTKMVCAVADEKGNIYNRITIPTTTPDETIGKMVDYFLGKDIEALGIGCFGPINLNKNSYTYGCITKTPKEGWSDVDMLTPFKKALNVPVGFDTDVNAAILGEVRFGNAKDCDNAIYITIGTGIGVGVYINGGLLHGLLHPEAGHILIKPRGDDTYEGCCPFHKSCFEGLASGPSIEKRWGRPAYELYDNEQVWGLEAYYIAQAIADYIFTYSPEKIILWGGVMHNKKLYNLVYKKVSDFLGEYIEHNVVNYIDTYIVKPGLGDNSGIIGATQLGFNELKCIS
ncbi:MAG: ROK family protein [Lachnospiraceae bacterium]|nr:ROK family protein [Lachnospiraceae bacterium]